MLLRDFRVRISNTMTDNIEQNDIQMGSENNIVHCM